MDGFLGEIKWFSGTFEPAYWKFCWGQLLNITEYSALFAVIGNVYGGDGTHNFALPDLRSRVPIGAGQGANMTMRNIGDKSGSETEIITLDKLGAHNHQINTVPSVTTNLTPRGSGIINCSSRGGNSLECKNNYFAATSAYNTYINENATSNMNANAVTLNTNLTGDLVVNVQSQCSSIGGNNAHDNMQPWLCLNLIICVEGIFPERP